MPPLCNGVDRVEIKITDHGGLANTDPKKKIY
jgi:hypothetical protein